MEVYLTELLYQIRAARTNNKLQIIIDSQLTMDQVLKVRSKFRHLAQELQVKLIFE